MPGPMSDAVRRLAALAVEAGRTGAGLLAAEVAAVRAEVGPDITLITPGIRPAAASRHDQARTATPEEALRAGGRPAGDRPAHTAAPDPGAAAAAIAASLRRARRGRPAVTGRAVSDATARLGGCTVGPRPRRWIRRTPRRPG